MAEKHESAKDSAISPSENRENSFYVKPKIEGLAENQFFSHFLSRFNKKMIIDKVVDQIASYSKMWSFVF